MGWNWAVLAVIAGVAGCAGNGEGLDQNGQPIGTGSMPGGAVTADLESIEANVFTPICSKCHIGASAPEGLQLDAAHAYNLLVGVPSAEEPNLARVKPGSPDSSYMVLKIEGAPGIDGGQMPLGETPLPQATIDAIRQWIANGAPNVAGAPAQSEEFAVDATVPLDRSSVRAPLERVLIAFTREVDASLVNETTVTLERIADSPGEAWDAGETREAGEAGAQTIRIARRLVADNPAVLLLTPDAALDAGLYRVTLRGRGGAALADVSAHTLAADASFEFTVEPVR